MSTKCRNAPQTLSCHEVKKCVRAVAIMVYRYQPEVYHRIISAHDIAEALGYLSSGRLSTYHVEKDTLKKAFANKMIWEALKQKCPGRYDFGRASTVSDVIKSGSEWNSELSLKRKLFFYQIFFELLSML